MARAVAAAAASRGPTPYRAVRSDPGQSPSPADIIKPMKAAICFGGGVCCRMRSSHHALWVSLLAMHVRQLLATSSALVTASSPPTVDLREYLASEGLACCVEVLTRRSSWTQSGGGVDDVGDLPFLTDEQIGRLPMPQVKQNILKALAARERDGARRQRAHERQRAGWLEGWLENTLSALETLTRGFTLGFGSSFIFESLFLNRDFYTASEDLSVRIRRAAIRASALGGAVAVTMHGSAIIVPHAWRHVWLAGPVP